MALGPHHTAAVAESGAIYTWGIEHDEQGNTPSVRRAIRGNQAQATALLGKLQ